MVGCGGFGAACPDECDGAEGFNSPFDLGHDDSSDAAIAVALSHDHGSNASLTLDDDGADAAVALVVTGKNSR